MVAFFLWSVLEKPSLCSLIGHFLPSLYRSEKKFALPANRCSNENRRIRTRMTPFLKKTRPIKRLHRHPAHTPSWHSVCYYWNDQIVSESTFGDWRCTMKRKGLILSISLVVLLVLTTVDVQARRCCYNSVFLPFAVAGAVVGSVAAITAAVTPAPVYPACPGYYAPAPVHYGPYYPRSVWIPGHYNRYGYWVRGHWR
jgi:hypothetical protein